MKFYSSPISHFRIISLYDIMYTVTEILKCTSNLKPIKNHPFTSQLVLGISIFFLIIAINVFCYKFYKPKFGKITSFYIFIKFFFFKFVICNHIMNELNDIKNERIKSYHDWFFLIILVIFLDLIYLILGIDQIYANKNYYKNEEVLEKDKNKVKELFLK